jgi:DNA-directed RNA polymerase alpha subunit
VLLYSKYMDKRTKARLSDYSRKMYSDFRALERSLEEAPLRSKEGVEKVLEGKIEAYTDNLSRFYGAFPELRPVSDFEVSVRAQNVLEAANIQTVGDLAEYTQSQLHVVPSTDGSGYVARAGTVTLEELRETLLTPFGFDFKKE